MSTDLHIFLTERSLYDGIKQMSDARSKHNLLSGTLDGSDHLCLHRMDAVPTKEGINSLQQALGVNAEFVYLDDDCSKLKDWSDLAIKTTWFNQNGDWVRDIFPVQDAEICRVEDVTHLVELLQKPTLSQCLDWWDTWDFPENLRAHSMTVGRIAYLLAVWMRKRGIVLDPILAHRGGLVHDLDKITTLHITGAHGQMGAAFIKEQGYSQLAEITRAHIMSTILEPGFCRLPWELRLVYFADKLVEGDALVPFSERLSHLYERYPQYQAMMMKSEKPVWRLSDDICAIIGLHDHQALIERLEAFI